ncbi:Stk1 family PASTA domain-containing Ser/Thr kinase [Kitasatospora sp. NPDC101801]|uniref:Stk1 family PASTA domain-containing Ser/Thr kinase n=1 Tax=Kitasatospora sp. NPDC101801 TaxID=3364103 RepID=UPI0037F397EE
MDTTPDPLIGTLLDARYRVEQRIAVGGMATVYRATDTRLDRVVAVKVMHPSLAQDAEFTGRFIREAKAVARLAHPNVVNVFDQGADGRSVFLAMEYVPGRTLRDLLRDRGALSVRGTLDVLEPVLAALGAAHRAGLVHRDVKPENVLITDGGLVKVADFGLVRLLSGADGITETTSAGTVLGTVSYLAPEQIRPGLPTDQRVDVYAAGILLYEMLTGAKPYQGENPMQVIYRHLHEDVPPPSLVAPGAGAELDAIVAAATSRDPGARPYDAVELLAALQRARRQLTPARLDAEPPASARRSPQHPTTEATSVLDQRDRVERTSVLDVPTMMLARPRPYDEPAPARRSRPRRSRKPLIWAAVLAAVLLLVGGTTYTLSNALYAEVPAIVAQTQAEAVRTLDGAGLQGSFAQQFSETVPAGQVMATDPGVGARARKSDPVRVTLSKGPERVTVPGLAGKTLEDARKELAAARLTPGTVTEEFSDTVAQGTVLATAPAADARLAVDAPVALTVSKGMRPVPNVVGLGRDEAEKALKDAGFKARLPFLTLGLGKVTKQEPAAGQPARQGTEVTITPQF